MTILPQGSDMQRVVADVAPDRYSGWLQSVRRSSAAPRVHNLENIVEFCGGWTELWRLKWSKTIETTWHTGARCYFLSLVLDGAPEAERRNVTLARATPYAGRRVSLVPPNQTMCSSSPEGGEVHAMRCFIDAESIETICTRVPSEDDLAALAALDISGGPIEWLLFQMYRELCNGKLGAAAAVECHARMISIEIARIIDSRWEKGQHTGGLPAWRMRLLNQRAFADGALPNVADLADACGMSARHLSRAFRDETGKTVGQFIAEVMVVRASRMLEAGDPVGIVADTLGYASSSSFAHAFHRETGLLPSDVRDELRPRHAN